ncbi:DNA topoisomerase, partial [Bacteroides ovatus]
NLQPGERYDNLYLSAKSRSEADWLIGINATQALSVAAGQGVFSLGRVQTPTLVMICGRYLENRNFVPAKFWQLKAVTASGGINFTAQSTAKWEQQPEAIAALQR